MKKQIASIALFLGLLTGCAGTLLDQKRAELQRQGLPAPYIDGHVDGCNAGTRAAGNPYFSFTKDVNRFDRDSQYRQGWNDGFTSCKSRYERL